MLSLMRVRVGEGVVRGSERGNLIEVLGLIWKIGWGCEWVCMRSGFFYCLSLIDLVFVYRRVFFIVVVR